jgi:hypothetical protein
MQRNVVCSSTINFTLEVPSLPVALLGSKYACSIAGCLKLTRTYLAEQCCSQIADILL